MGDIFRRESAANPEPFTGERLTSALDGQTQIEHYHRYLFARSLCAGLDVLDVASGEGYGSAQLAQVARSVVGVEYSESTVRSAAANFPRANLCYLRGDARALPLADASVDIVVSFETIEHFDGQEAFLSEVHRVLRPDGQVIVSTPDRDVYSAAHIPPNEFHVRELSRIEFVTLLHKCFSHIEVLLQRPMIGSAIVPESSTPAVPLVFDRRGTTHFEACAGMPRAPYMVAVAANRPIQWLPSSLFIERGDLDTDRLAWAACTSELDRVRTSLAAAHATLRETHLQLDAARAMLIKNTKTWSGLARSFIAHARNR